jgi:Ni/Fe-hydrogenase subunit HybB-like protein
MRWAYAISAIALLAAGLALMWIGYSTRSAEDIAWGLLVPGYVYFALMATGSSIVNSIYTVFHYEGPNKET